MKAPGKRRRFGLRLAAFFLFSLALCVALPPFAWPVDGRVSSGFFFRHRPDSSLPLAFEFHKGLDIASPAGTTVRASAPGIVIDAGSASDLGNYVRVRHAFGIVTTYAHLSRVDVQKGSIIVFRRFVSLGAVGSTGRATGPHLHFAATVGGLRLPPRLLLSFHGLRRAIIGF